MSESFSKKVSIFSIIFLFTISVFSYGLIVGNFQIWPYKPIKSMYSAALSIIRFGELVPVNRLIKAPEHVSRERFVIYSDDKVQSGYYAYMGYDGPKQKYMAWLMDAKGNKLHEWDLTYEYLDKNGPLNGSDSPHAFKVLKDGSLVVSFDSGDVLARIDQCSKPIWTKEGVYHHSLSIDDNGNLWAWRGENTAYAYYNYLENINSITGDTISEIGLIEDLLQSPDSSGNIYGVRADYNFQHFDETPKNKEEHDLFHPNDLDVLSSDIADKFKDFNAGDLLLSFRNNHLVAVVDPKTKKLKWWSTGPWKFQHDPDFTSDGKISVYSNNTDYGRSEIIKIDPVSKNVENELEKGDLFFYSKTQGKHQYLPNGNLLIIMPDEGRAVQVTSEGNKVFEYNNVSAISKQYNEHLANGIWFSDDYFNSVPDCPTK